MDLSERQGAPAIRHPWETSRVLAIEKIVRRFGFREARVLDVGCGDGYLVRDLSARLGFREVVGQDIHLSDPLIESLSAPNLRFVRELDGLDYRADLLLLLDVLEHLDDPQQILAELGRERLTSEGRMLITVPAFQWLYTGHDLALKHVRRYSREALVDEVGRAGLVVLDSGYLFSSLLLPRAVSALRERLLPKPQNGVPYSGVGAWKAPTLVTRLLHASLAFDNSVCLAARELGVTIPGLSVWLTCKTRS